MSTPGPERRHQSDPEGNSESASSGGVEIDSPEPMDQDEAASTTPTKYSTFSYL